MKLTASIARVVAFIGTCALAACVHEPARSDQGSFTVELDNEHVRVTHVAVPPHAKLQLHELAGALVVPLADYQSTFNKPNGETATVERKTGKAVWVEAGAREVESGDHGVDALIIEVKQASAKKQAPLPGVEKPFLLP